MVCIRSPAVGYRKMFRSARIEVDKVKPRLSGWLAIVDNGDDPCLADMVGVAVTRFQGLSQERRVYAVNLVRRFSPSRERRDQK